MYSFLCFFKRYTENTIVKNSENTGAIQTPSIPKTKGRIIIIPAPRTNERKKDIAAEAFPLHRAVKNEEANILIPDIINDKAKILNPESVIFSSTADPELNAFKIGLEKISDMINIATDTDKTIPKHFLKRFLS